METARQDTQISILHFLYVLEILSIKILINVGGLKWVSNVVGLVISIVIFGNMPLLVPGGGGGTNGPISMICTSITMSKNLVPCFWVSLLRHIFDVRFSNVVSGVCSETHVGFYDYLFCDRCDIGCQRGTS